MNYLACRVDYWRNFVSYAPDINILIAATTDPIFVDLRPYIIQGAVQIDNREVMYVDASTPNKDPVIRRATTNADSYTGRSPIAGVLDKIPTERGWMLRYVQLNSPQHGITYPADDRLGFYYKATTASDSVDCFNYYFTNGTQRSNLGRVSVISQIPYPSGTNVETAYEFMGGTLGTEDAPTTMLVDGSKSIDDTRQYSLPVELVLKPKIDGVVRNKNLMLVGFKIYYNMPNKPQGYTVYNWDGTSFYQCLSSAFQANPANPYDATLAFHDSVTFEEAVPLYDTYPQFKIVLNGSYNPQGDGIVDLAEIEPILVSSSAQHDKVMAHYIELGLITESTDASS